MWRKRPSLAWGFWPFGRGRQVQSFVASSVDDLSTERAVPSRELTAIERGQLGRATWRKYERLRPADDSLEAFVAWWVTHGGDPADELLIDHYAEVSDVMGWRAPSAPIAINATTLPRPETTVAKPLPPLSGADAAHLFLTWLYETGRAGRYSSTALQELYAEHAQEIGRQETPANVWRPVFKDLAGVTVAMAEVRDAKGTRSARRERSRHYTIHAEVHEPLRAAA